ncbi:transposase [Geotalea sp. SG265]|uniref:transposase n=1 Tax=Geotalea sp. SG265 TaxID=2922867 RepID=UPI001FAFA739|nr:transposase [Geotalea sp. SG265]
MGRKPRLHYPGALYHVILRGNAREKVFFANVDRNRFYLFLQEGVERYRFRVHAFCLMTNHIHLALQVGDVSLSRIMQGLVGRYTRWVNWRKNRVGHLFQGRYKAVMVDADAYLAELVRYIHLNPLRADMVDDPCEYPWSSHRAYCGKESIGWLTTEFALGCLCQTASDACEKFCQFVADGIADGHRAEFHSGMEADSRLLGDDTFADKVLDEAERRSGRVVPVDKFLEMICLRYNLASLQDLAGGSRIASTARGVAAKLATDRGICTLTELAGKVKRDVSTLSSAAERIRAREKRDPQIAEQVRELSQQLAQLQA